MIFGATTGNPFRDLCIGILCAAGLLVSIFLVALTLDVIQYLSRRFFPCASEGMWCHRVTVFEYGRARCNVCSVTWTMTGKLYSIASQGDPESFIPVWERDK